MKVKGKRGGNSDSPAAAENKDDKDEAEIKVVVKTEPEDSSNGIMINIDDKTEVNTNNTGESAANTEAVKPEQDLPQMKTSNDSDKTVVNVGLPDSGVISYESILTQVLGSQPGTHLIVHLQEASPDQVQMVMDGKITPVTNVGQVISGSTTITVAPPVKKVKMLPPQKNTHHRKETRGRPRKKRGGHSVVIDELTQLTGESFKCQLLNTSDIVKALDLAPPTKRVMEYTSTIDSDSLFGFPGRPHSSKPILDAFSRNLTPVMPADKNRKRKLPAVRVEECFSDDIASML